MSVETKAKGVYTREEFIDLIRQALPNRFQLEFVCGPAASRDAECVDVVIESVGRVALNDLIEHRPGPTSIEVFLRLRELF